MAEANFRLNLDIGIGIDAADAADAADLESLPPTQPYGCTEHGIDLDSLNFDNRFR